MDRKKPKRTKSQRHLARSSVNLTPIDKSNIMKLQKMWNKAIGLSELTNGEDSEGDPDKSPTSLELLFTKLFELQPEAKLLLESVDSRLRALEGIFSIFVKFQDGQYDPSLALLGKRHKDWGVVKVWYISLVVSLVYTLDIRVGDQFTPDIQTAFVKWYCSVANVMLKGEDGKKVKYQDIDLPMVESILRLENSREQQDHLKSLVNAEYSLPVTQSTTFLKSSSTVSSMAHISVDGESICTSLSAPELGLHNSMIQPEKVRYIKGHQVIPHHFRNPTDCHVCNDFLWSIYKKGSRCINCGMAIHDHCRKNDAITHCNGLGEAASLISTGAVFRSHVFKHTTYKRPTFCLVCSGLLVGIVRQGYQCSGCKANVHSRCKAKLVTTCDPSICDNAERERLKKHKAETEKKKKELDSVTPAESQTIEDFDVDLVLSSGAFYKTYRAKHKDNASEHFYIRSMSKSFFEVVNRSPLYERDVLVTSTSPFILGLYWCFQDLYYIYFVSENITGFSLQSLFDFGDLVSEKSARFYAAEIICGLDYLHRTQIIHKDVTLDNILLDNLGHVRITGLQYCQATEMPASQSSLTSTLYGPKAFFFCGTPEYMAPEILGEDPVCSFPVDYWSLGVLLYYLTVGKAPFTGETDYELYENILLADLEFPDTMTDEAVAFLCGLMNRNPNRRLGMHGGESVKRHFFFSGMSWDQIETRKQKGPFLPRGPSKPVELDSTSRISFIESQNLDESGAECPTQKIDKVTIYKTLYYENPTTRMLVPPKPHISS